VCIEKLDALVDTADSKLQDYRKLFLKLEDPEVLYLAILLHDTGKAANVRHHSEASALSAQRVAARLQLNAAQRKTLIFLVDHHSTLSNTAQRRNLEDPATVAEFASLVGNQRNLDALMILTLVDGQGVGGENVWSDWKESLVWQLYRSSSLYLADDVEYYRRRRVEREELQKAVEEQLGGDFAEEVAAHFRAMPDRYLMTYPVEAIGEHIRLFRKFFKRRLAQSELALAPALAWIPHPHRGHTEFWFCGWDRHGLLARIAGSLSAAGVNILSADAFTRDDSLVLDIFRICTREFEAVTDSAAFAAAEKVLLGALEDETYDFSARVSRSIGKRGFVLSEAMDFPTRIAVDNTSHPVYTLLDVQTPDRLGLLHALLKALSEEGLDIALSRINTEKGAALDTFYITDEVGQKVRDSERLSLLQKALWKAAAPASRKE
jgi:[protein-PII] uridylyltransferase